MNPFTQYFLHMDMGNDVLDSSTADFSQWRHLPFPQREAIAGQVADELLANGDVPTYFRMCKELIPDFIDHYLPRK